MMLVEGLKAAQEGSLPFVFGTGHSDYVYRGNVAAAHLQLWRSLRQRRLPHPATHPGLSALTEGRGGGSVYFITDYHASMWEQMAPYLAAKGLALPRLAVPVWVMSTVANALEAWARAAHSLCLLHLRPLLARNVVQFGKPVAAPAVSARPRPLALPPLLSLVSI